MDGTAAGSVVTVIPQPVAAGGGAAEVAEAVAVEVGEAAAVVDSSQAQDKKGLSALRPFFRFSNPYWLRVQGDTSMLNRSDGLITSPNAMRTATASTISASNARSCSALKRSA